MAFDILSPICMVMLNLGMGQTTIELSDGFVWK